MRRFIGLEKRLLANLELKDMYTEFIHEYILMGHMKEVTEKNYQNQNCQNVVYYLPHHAVLKPDSTTTKLRVVFDASCRTSTGISLNDGLMVGPTIQNDLLSIILRFRLHRYAICADIEKMYRMVMIQQPDQHLQRILWRDSPDEKIRTYELTTVTYGTASAPYLATRCLRKLGEDSSATHPIGSKNLLALEGLSVPRWVGFSGRCLSVQLHGFCDASELAYGACLYLRCVHADDSVTVRLLTAKSRVAPLENLKLSKRKTTIPRLELSSALILSHLYEKFVSVNPNIKDVYLWTDSMIVKHWLASHPSRWQVYVANRVSEIQHITKMAKWNHVAGIENPADLISRGASPKQLRDQSLWFDGPKWLSQQQQSWPVENNVSSEEFEPTLLEEKPTTTLVALEVTENEILKAETQYSTCSDSSTA
ncbi:uncharacterized protein LOC129741423 [Uranotaenia lowii]|uniref:uncharacterized protein LOC129741423 n=1 Tax=Uranotaenia lowii TaxID=190385 RepID=UPI00247A3291|nr:uncharacterized protein LOC129741423 [Uranotaenia lowii]